MQEEHSAIYQKMAKVAVKNMTKRGTNAFLAKNRQEARKIVIHIIPEGVTIETTASSSLLQIGVFSTLRKSGKTKSSMPLRDMIRDTSQTRWRWKTGTRAGKIIVRRIPDWHYRGYLGREASQY